MRVLFLLFCGLCLSTVYVRFWVGFIVVVIRYQFYLKLDACYPCNGVVIKYNSDTIACESSVDH